MEPILQKKNELNEICQDIMKEINSDRTTPPELDGYCQSLHELYSVGEHSYDSPDYDFHGQAYILIHRLLDHIRYKKAVSKTAQKDFNTLYNMLEDSQKEYVTRSVQQINNPIYHFNQSRKHSRRRSRNKRNKQRSRRQSRKRSRRRSRNKRNKQRSQRQSRKRSRSQIIKLISIKKSPKSGKKLRATFNINGKERHTDFGAAGMSDYTKHHDIERRSRYITRHKKDLRTNDPTRAGYLSMYVLWNKPTISGSISDYRKRLGQYNKTGKFPKQIGKTSNRFGSSKHSRYKLKSTHRMHHSRHKRKYHMPCQRCHKEMEQKPSGKYVCPICLDPRDMSAITMAQYAGAGSQQHQPGARQAWLPAAVGSGHGSVSQHPGDWDSTWGWGKKNIINNVDRKQLQPDPPEQQIYVLQGIGSSPWWQDITSLNTIHFWTHLPRTPMDANRPTIEIIRNSDQTTHIAIAGDIWLGLSMDEDPIGYQQAGSSGRLPQLKCGDGIAVPAKLIVRFNRRSTRVGEMMYGRLAYLLSILQTVPDAIDANNRIKQGSTTYEDDLEIIKNRIMLIMQVATDMILSVDFSDFPPIEGEIITGGLVNPQTPVNIISSETSYRPMCTGAFYDDR